VPERGTVVVLEGRRVALQWLARTALLLLWSLVAWGVLLLLATLTHAVGEGPRPALARLLPAGGASIWAWVNVLSVALALGVGLVAAGLLARGRRGKAEG
jgi:hypothetical protein